MAQRKLTAAFVIAFFQLTAQAQDDAASRLPYEPLPAGRTEVRYSLSRNEQSRDESGVKVRFEFTYSTLGLAHGITDRLEIGASLPYFHSSKRDVEPLPGLTLSDNRHGQGDPSVYAAYSLFKEADGSAGTTGGVIFKPNNGGGGKSFFREADVTTPHIAVGESLTPT